MKKQAVFVRIPNYEKMMEAQSVHLGEVIKECLDAQFPDREIVVLISQQDIHFLEEYEVNEMIETLRDLKK